MFLKNTAQHILTNYTDNLSAVTIVFPSRRACVYLKEYIAQRITEPIILPTIITIEDLFAQLSGLTVIGNIELCMEFYKIYREKNEQESFEDFLSWAQTVLNDFNEIDLNLVDAKGLYSFVNEAKAIKLWNLEQRELTDYERKYLAFYNSFYTYYVDLNNELCSKNKAYQGMAYKTAIEQVKSQPPKKESKQYVFAGFNALNKAEETLFELLQVQEKVEFIWDIDAYYYNDNNQEAGYFLRKNIAKWPIKQDHWLEDNFSLDKKIRLIGVNGQATQTKMAGIVLEELNKDDILNTALVLADETLLLPMLYSIPTDIKSFNVTMGLTVRQLPLYDLLKSIFMLHENAERLAGVMHAKDYAFYHKDISKVLDHPYMVKLFAELVITNKIEPDGKVFYTREDIISLIDSPDECIKSTFSLIFSNWTKEQSICIDAFTNLFVLLNDVFINESKHPNNGVIAEVEFIKLFKQVIDEFELLIQDTTIIKSIRGMHLVFDHLVKAIQIPFVGEPLQGLQIMGMLESRNLDFNTVVLLGVNEGIIPKQRSNNTFIPFDFRNEFGLPTYRDRDAIYSYLFYSLIQRAKQVVIIYNALVNDLGGGEPSRFITQLLYELPKYNAAITIEQEILDVPIISQVDAHAIEIKKTDAVMQSLMNKAKSGFSPTSLNAYISCKLKFYLRELAGINETDEVEDFIDPQTMGKAVHAVLEELYKPYVKAQITSEVIDGMLKKYQSILMQKYQTDYTVEELSFGRNYLIVGVSDKFIKRFLESEKGYVETLEKQGSSLIIEQLEGHLHASIQLKNSTTEVKLKGYVDRIDRVGELTRIVDYKTGKVEKNDVVVKAWPDIIGSSKGDKSFQLLMYAYLYQQSTKANHVNLSAGNFSFRNSKAGFIGVSVPEVEQVLSQSALNLFEEQLLILLDELFNTSISFTQTDDTDACKYCPYSTMCGR